MAIDFKPRTVSAIENCFDFFRLVYCLFYGPDLCLFVCVNELKISHNLKVTNSELNDNAQMREPKQVFSYLCSSATEQEPKKTS